MNHYSGIGSRQTPDYILKIMRHIGYYLASENWILRSGAAQGADSAFEDGALAAKGQVEIYLPWKYHRGHTSEMHPLNYPFCREEMEIAEKFHPAWHRCNAKVRLLHQRGLRQIVGLSLLPGNEILISKLIVCWTPNGELTGGTAQALRIAMDLKIPIINLGLARNNVELETLLLKIEKIVEDHKCVKTA